jgi:hypothetical protein
MIIGIIVALGWSFSTASYSMSALVNSTFRSTHLRAPPPFTCMHIVVHADRLLLVNVMPCWYDEEIRREGGIAPQCADTLQNISGVLVENLAVNDDF